MYFLEDHSGNYLWNKFSSISRLPQDISLIVENLEEILLLRWIIELIEYAMAYWRKMDEAIVKPLANYPSIHRRCLTYYDCGHNGSLTNVWATNNFGFRDVSWSCKSRRHLLHNWLPQEENSNRCLSINLRLYRFNPSGTKSVERSVLFFKKLRFWSFLLITRSAFNILQRALEAIRGCD